MIIVKLMGGLGNQLFQYAAGRALAEHKNTHIKLDISWFNKQSLRNYRLEYLKIKTSIASISEIEHITLNKNVVYYKFRKFFQEQLPYYRRSVFNEQNPALYDNNIWKTPKKVYLKGYWQSENYFSCISGQLRKEFIPKKEPDKVNAQLIEYIRRVNSVSIHVRRRDYVSNPTANRYHGLCTLEYYQQAIQIVAEQVSTPHFFIFSDDPDWSQANLKLSFPLRLVKHNDVEKDYEDLRLISHCKHHIIANSSFSWWGAWLNKNPYKIVITPKRWFREPDQDTKDRIPATWIKI